MSEPTPIIHFDKFMEQTIVNLHLHRMLSSKRVVRRASANQHTAPTTFSTISHVVSFPHTHDISQLQRVESLFVCAPLGVSRSASGDAFYFSKSLASVPRHRLLGQPTKILPHPGIGNRVQTKRTGETCRRRIQRRHRSGRTDGGVARGRRGAGQGAFWLKGAAEWSWKIRNGQD
jgi:hypothetical protein